MDSLESFNSTLVYLQSELSNYLLIEEEDISNFLKNDVSSITVSLLSEFENSIRHLPDRLDIADAKYVEQQLGRWPFLSETVFQL